MTEQKNVNPAPVGQINVSEAVGRALLAIDAYLAGTPLISGGDRLGQWHGEMGKRRARKLKKILLWLPEDFRHPKTVSSIFLGLFGEPTFLPKLGSSSLLACHIADRWITGSRSHVTGDLEFHDSLASEVFPREILTQLIDDRESYTSNPIGEVGGSIDFDAVKAVRLFYQIYLKSLNPTDKFFVKKLSSLIKSILNSGSEDIELEKILSLIKSNAPGPAYIMGA